MIRRYAMLVALALAACSSARANNIVVSGATLINAGSHNVDVEFSVTWDNNFTVVDGNSSQAYDRAWMFVKYWVTGVDDEESGWHHATLVPGGTLTPTADGRGAIAEIGTDQTLRWNFGADGVARDADVKVRVCAIETVYIPGGEFVYNAAGAGGSLNNNYGAGQELTIDGTDDVPVGAAAGWPNGYSAFHVAKYEVSQEQYSDFLNMVDVAKGTARYVGAFNVNGQRIDYTGGNPYGSRYASDEPNRAANYTSWYDATEYTAWCGLRPMTEMEFEKAARGGGPGVETYPWGNTVPSSTTYTPPEGGTHKKFYANWSASTLKPLAVGLYLSGDVARSNPETGASPYGLADLGGNLKEQVINCAQVAAPANGDGSAVAPPSWPLPAFGKGWRGGSFNDSSTYTRSSDRVDAGNTSGSRLQYIGIRPARTAE